ncbi:MAG: sulfurtransferase [Candidatus Dormibacteria bacterium]
MVVQPSLLTSPESLAEELDGPAPPVVLDVRWALGGPPGREEYARGHIPGAVFVDLDSQLAGPPGGGRGRHPLPDVDHFQRAMRAAGVSQARGVVVYDAGPALSAARAWWLLRHFGHGRVAVLDGGLPAWLEAGGGLATAVPEPPGGDFVARAGGMPVVDPTEVLDIASTGVLIDARAPERYRGEVEPVDPVAGHIPGARSLPTVGNVGKDGRFLDAAALRSRFGAIGVLPGVAVAAYCGSGVTAAHTVLALEFAGIQGAALYPGSWSEWISDPAHPVATGADPLG